MRVLLALFALTGPALAQPADCVPDQPADATIPLYLQLDGLPGVPRGVRGGVFAAAPATLGGTTCQAAQPALPADVLHGTGPDVLHGTGPRDLLRGQRQGQVFIETR